jgi:hypothetical protein
MPYLILSDEVDHGLELPTFLFLIAALYDGPRFMDDLEVVALGIGLVELKLDRQGPFVALSFG